MPVLRVFGGYSPNSLLFAGVLFVFLVSLLKILARFWVRAPKQVGPLNETVLHSSHDPLGNDPRPWRDEFKTGSIELVYRHLEADRDWYGRATRRAAVEDRTGGN